MAINERLIDTAVAASGDTGNAGEEGLILHLDANDVDSYDGDGDEWVDITNHEYTPAINVSEHFNTVTYDGNGGVQNNIAVGFQPDFMWFKVRDEVDNHALLDSVRGDDSVLYSNLTAQAGDWGGVNNTVDFVPNGFSLKRGKSETNLDTKEYVAWCFKAGGAPSGSDKVSIDGTSYADEAAAGLTAGTIAVSGLSVNTDLGFSIAKVVDHTNTKTISHGLGIAPELIITKVLDNGTYDWYVYHKDLGNDKYLNLNTTGAATIDNYWNYTSPTSQVFTHKFSNTAYDMIYYSFTSKRGVSKVGSYTGANSSVFVDTGFEPAFVMIKYTSGSIGYGGWFIYDNKRDTTNPVSVFMQANTNATEFDNSSYSISFNSTGFTVGSTQNDGINYNNNKYIYYAVAKNTNETSLIAPGTNLKLHLDADSFPQYGEAGYSNTPTTWTALTGSNGTITGATFDSELGNYLDFDGSDDWVETNYTPPTGSNNFSTEVWFNYTYDSATRGVFSTITNSGANRLGINLHVYQGAVRVLGYDSAGVDILTGSSITNGWHHAALTYEGGLIKLYIDGELQSSTINQVITSHYGTLGIGLYYRSQTSTSNWNGKIGQFRVYDAVLTEAQIRQNYNFTKPSYPNGYNGALGTGTKKPTWNAGGYFDFDGSDDYVSIPSTATSPFEASARNFTLSMWINRDTAGYDPLITKYGTTSATRSWYFQINTSGQLEMRWWNGSSFISKTATSAIVNTTGVWYHVALSVNASTMDFYVNGVLKNSLTGSVTHISGGNEPINIGSQAEGNYNFFNGQISKVKMHDKALIQSEITALYNEGE